MVLRSLVLLLVSLAHPLSASAQIAKVDEKFVYFPGATWEHKTPAKAGLDPAVLKDAIEAGGSSLRDHKRTDGELGMFQHNFRVYDREGEPCPTAGCKGIVRRFTQNGRSTFYCRVCQK